MTSDYDLSNGLCFQRRFRGNSQFNWYPELLDIEAEQRARAVCARCPVQWECAQTALENREAWGIWGGMEEFRMRRALGKDSFGSNRARTLDLVCPYCNSTDLEIAKKRTSKGYHVECNYCSIEWVTYRIPEKVRKAAQKQNDMGDRMDNSRATDGPRQA
jgi:hypothetical protein